MMETFKTAIIVLSLSSINNGQSQENNTANYNSSSRFVIEQYNGTSLSYCNHTMTSNSSGVVSNKPPMSSFDNKSCEMILRAPEGHHIRLFFRTLTLQVSPGCFASRVSIYQGSYPKWHANESYCGFQQPFNTITETNEVLIKFETSNLKVSFENVFEIEYFFINVTYMRLNEKPKEMFDTNGGLTNRPHNALYRLEDVHVYAWKIQVNFDSSIQMDWGFENIRDGMYLEINDGPLRSVTSRILCQGRAHTRLDSIIGSCSILSNLTQHGELLSSSSSVYILFSDAFDAYETFHLNYSTKTMSDSVYYKYVCGETKINLENQWPYILKKSTMPSSQCVITVETEENYGINIEFSKIHFDGFNHGRCEYGGIVIQDRARQIGPFCSTNARTSDGYIPNLSTYVSSSNLLKLVIFCRHGCFTLEILALFHKTVCKTIHNHIFRKPFIPSRDQPCRVFEYTLNQANSKFSYTFPAVLQFQPKVSSTLSSCRLTIARNIPLFGQTMKDINKTLTSPSCLILPLPALYKISVTCLWSPALFRIEFYDLNLDSCPLLRQSGNYQNHCGVFITAQLYTTETTLQYIELRIGIVNADMEIDCKGQAIEHRCKNELSMPYYFSIEFIAKSKHGCRFVHFNVTEKVRTHKVIFVCKTGHYLVPYEPITSTLKVLSMCEKSTHSPLPFLDQENAVAGKVLTMAAHDVLVRFSYLPFSVPFAVVSYMKHTRNVTEQSQLSNCPEGFVFYEGSCYLLNTYNYYTELLSWSDAEHECNTRNATLLSMATRKEANDVRHLMAGRWLRPLFVSERTVIMIGLGNFIQVKSNKRNAKIARQCPKSEISNGLLQ